MSVDKFKFVSPGVFLDEIDESGIPALPERMGPMVVGRFRKGPGNRPIKVESYKEFARLFGDPSPGNASGDIWRTGELTAPTYAAYAVKAWLRNNSPCTVYRVLGEQAGNADSGQAPEAGWITDKSFTSDDIASVGGAYGLFVTPNPESYGGGSGATATVTITAFSQLNAGDKVTLIAADGTSHDFSQGDQSSVNGTFEATTSNDVTATNLMNVINTSSGPSGTRFTATVEGAVVTITQATGGQDGNTAVTLTDSGTAGMTKVDFSGGTGHNVTGTLAAVWYLQEGALVLTGTARDGIQRQGAGVFIKSDSGLKFTAKILNRSEVVQKTATFDFDRDSQTFIRKVFNADPAKTNSAIGPTSSTTLTYWLGETFESNLRANENSKLAITGSGVTDNSNFLGVVLALDGGNGSGEVDWNNHKQAARAAQTGWFISQDTRGSVTAGEANGFNPITDTEKLFKFHGLDSGEQANREYKVSIVDIKAPSDNFNKFGSFTVQIRKSTDTDSSPVVREQYTGCNLNPTSADYIGRKIGEKYYTYDEDNKRIIEHGDNDNRSEILRVEVSPLVSDGGAEGLNPYGVYGPTVPKTHEVLQTTTGTIVAAGSGSTNCLPSASLVPRDALGWGHQENQMISGSSAIWPFTASIAWPTSRLRTSSSEGSLVLPSKAYFGYQSSITDVRRFDKTNLDLLRGQPQALDPAALDSNGTLRQYSWVFTLDDVEQSGANTKQSAWVSGSRAAGRSWTAKSGSAFVLTGSGAGFKKFTSPMFGGFDGFDVTEQDPLRNSYMDGSPTEANNSTYYSLKKAIDIISDADFLEFDVATLPGITNTSLTSQLVTTCEDRADSLAIIDVPGGYKPPHERNGGETDAATLGSVEDTVNTLKDMNLNSSYGCAFYPWVKVRDNVANSMLYVPPSVVALGTFSSAQRKSAVWFAPAGFTRGGLSEGSAGLPVVGVRSRLTSDERDRLYDANVNPIASFPAEGIVIFGQKTLQVTPSALDRINVRRLLIHVKKEVSRIASRILFDQNVQETWDRFKGQVEPFLTGVKAGLGLTDFRVVLDSTTTTPDLVDRNILYAKIFLKPARAIEFIALDFIITRSGASFDD